MTDSQNGPVAYVAGSVLILAGIAGLGVTLWLLFRQQAIPTATVTALLGAGFLCTLLGVCLIVDTWRQGVARGIHRAWAKTPIGDFGLGGREEPQPIDKAPPAPGRADVEAKVEKIERELEPKALLAGIAKKPDGADILFDLAVRARAKQNLYEAKLILDAALEQHPEHPKLLIFSGWIWAKLGDADSAIRAYEKAASAAKDQEEWREQFYLANSNLAFRLAKLGRNKERCLSLAELAADHADEFENRDSFLINYGYAQMRFAETREELVGSVQYLTELLSRNLQPEEVLEVNRYVEENLKKLNRLLAPETSSESSADLARPARSS